MTIGDFLDVIEYKLPPAPIEEIEHLEEELGTRLPDDYRDFLIACNGGYVGGKYWFQAATTEGVYAEAGVHHIGGFRQESYFSLNWTRNCYAGRIPDALMWIMDDPFGNAICLGTTGVYAGKIYFWDHENEPDEEDWDGSVEAAGNLQLLANSFTEFVAGLRPLSDLGTGDDTEAT